MLVGCGGEEEPSNSTMYFVHTDHLGTPTVITDNQDTPTVVWEVQRDPFGETVVVTEEIEFEVRFPGQYFDGETGLHYNYFRDYDPGLGRYVQSDPIGLRGGLNTYGYSYQNPIMYIDPYGLWCNPLLAATAAGAAGGLVTGFLGGGLAGGIGGVLVGGNAGFLGERYGGKNEAVAGGMGALAGAADSGGGLKGRVIGAVGGGLGGILGSHGTNTGGMAPSAAGGLVGGAIGGLLGDSRQGNDRRFIGSGLQKGLKGGLHGLAGGLTEDFVSQILEDWQDCEKDCE